MQKVSPHPPGVKAAPVVALTTDFGYRDPYVGILKGVLLGLCPGARLVDVTHGLPPQDVLAGCLALEAARPYFPRGTVHLAVVDPGVGTDRAALAVRTDDALFVAPDNGLLSFLAPEEVREVRRIESPEVLRGPVSRTFHGRDVFAPAAGHLAAGLPLADLGPPAPALRRLDLPEPVRRGASVRGEVLAFDGFGNALTNVREADLPPGAARVRAGGHEIPVGATYAAVPPGAAVALVGSTGRLEVSVRDGSARAALGLGVGDEVVVEP